jgi:hypothetical protein
MFLQLNAPSSYNGVCKKRERGRRVVRDCPIKSRESIPLEGSPGRPYIESRRPGYIQRDRFSGPSSRAPEGGKTSKLELQGRSSCLGVSVCPGMVVVMVLFPHCSMAWHDAIVSGVTALLTPWGSTNCPVQCELAVAFVIVSCSPGSVVATVRE